MQMESPVFLAELMSNAPKVPILSNKTVRANVTANIESIQVAAHAGSGTAALHRNAAGALERFLAKGD